MNANECKWGLKTNRQNASRHRQPTPPIESHNRLKVTFTETKSHRQNRMRPARTPLGLWDLCVETRCRREHRVSTQRPRRPKESAASRRMGSFRTTHRTARPTGAKEQTAAAGTGERPILPPYPNPTSAPSVSLRRLALGAGWVVAERPSGFITNIGRPNRRHLWRSASLRTSSCADLIRAPQASRNRDGVPLGAGSLVAERPSGFITNIGRPNRGHLWRSASPRTSSCADLIRAPQAARNRDGVPLGVAGSSPAMTVKEVIGPVKRKVVIRWSDGRAPSLRVFVPFS
jgi:hypothetical protein